MLHRISVEQYHAHPQANWIVLHAFCCIPCTACNNPSSLHPQVCGCLHSLAILREHRHPLTHLLASQLAVVAVGGSGAGVTAAGAAAAVVRQAPQLAATLLAAQAERQQSPLLEVLPPSMQAQVLDHC